MNILILSDTHGQIHPDILSLGGQCELAIHCGDIGNSDVLKQLEAQLKLVVVRGNNDIECLWPEADHARLSTIPWETSVDLPGGKLGICHGHQEPSVPKRHAYLRSTFRDCRAITYGHSHLLTVDTEDSAHHVLNPGAAGKARTNGGPSCLILNAEETQWTIKSYRFAW